MESILDFEAQKPTDAVDVAALAVMPAEPPAAPAADDPDYAAMLERAQAQLADAETRLDEILTTTVHDGMGKTIERAELAVTVAQRKIRSLELRKAEALATKAAEKEAARRAAVEKAAAEVETALAEISERTRVLLESIATAKGALSDISRLADTVRMQRRAANLRAPNAEIMAFERGRALPTFSLPMLLEKGVAANVIDLAHALPGVAKTLGIDADKTMFWRPVARDFEAALARATKEFCVEPAQALICTGKFGGQRDNDDAA